MIRRSVGAKRDEATGNCYTEITLRKNHLEELRIFQDFLENILDEYEEYFSRGEVCKDYFSTEESLHRILLRNLLETLIKEKSAEECEAVGVFTKRDLEMEEKTYSDEFCEKVINHFKKEFPGNTQNLNYKILRNCYKIAPFEWEKIIVETCAELGSRDYIKYRYNLSEEDSEECDNDLVKKLTEYLNSKEEVGTLDTLVETNFSDIYEESLEEDFFSEEEPSVETQFENTIPPFIGYKILNMFEDSEVVSGETD